MFSFQLQNPKKKIGRGLSPLEKPESATVHDISGFQGIKKSFKCLLKFLEDHTTPIFKKTILLLSNSNFLVLMLICFTTSATEVRKDEVQKKKN